MNKKPLIISSAILLILILVLVAGPRMPKPLIDSDLPAISIQASQVGAYVNSQEAAVKNIRPGNQSQVHYVNDSANAQTAYCLLYLHGFSASPMEGNPTHIKIGQAFGMNTYIPRLADHGLDSPDALLNMTPDKLWNSSKEALVLAKSLGKKVIVMGTSTGGALALKLAETYPDDVAALILYAPCIRIHNRASWLLARPYGLQFGRLVFGGRYRHLEKDPKLDPYWYQTYRVEGTVYLQQLVESTMKAKTFEKIHQPVFVGYYYKDDEHQDGVISVPAIQWMFDNLGTSKDKKIEIAFPDAGSHVIASDLVNPNWTEVYQATVDYLSNIVGLTPEYK